MKRRNFLKGLASLAMAAAVPVAMPKEKAEASPAHPGDINWTELDKLREERYELMRRAVRNHQPESSFDVCREHLQDVFISPDAMEDIRNWGCDAVDEQTRKEIFDTPVHVSMGCAILDNRKILLADFDPDYQPLEPSDDKPNSDVEIVVGLPLTDGKPNKNDDCFSQIDRNELHELGRRGPYHRFVEFPVDITEKIELSPEEEKYEKGFAAFTIPGMTKIPERHIVGEPIPWPEYGFGGKKGEPTDGKKDSR